MKGWLVRALQPRNERISCKGQNAAKTAGRPSLCMAFDVKSTIPAPYIDRDRDRDSDRCICIYVYVYICVCV